MDLIPIARHVEALAAAFPDRLAVADEHRPLTYGALNAAANRVAHAVIRRGGAGPTVAVLCDHRADRVVATLAVLKSGIGLVVLDATYPDRALADLIGHAEAAVVVADDANGARARRIAGTSRSVVVVGADTDVERATDPAVAITLESLAALRYTSGSTGAPKGVVHSQRTLAFLARRSREQHDLTPADRVSLFNSFWLSLVCATLTGGASLHLHDLRRQGLTRVGAWLNEERITVYMSIPTVFRQAVAGLAPDYRATTVRGIGLSGEPVLAADVATARRHFPPECIFLNGFGSSEFSQIAEFRCGLDTPLPPGLLPAGRPIPGVELAILDDDGRPLAVGERGLIAVRTAYLTSGYWREPELTRRMLVPDPETPGSSLYVTGDIGWIDGEGTLHVAGRKDQQIKIRGNRLSPGEIEQALMTHADVAEAAVQAIADPGEAPRLAAYYVAKPDTSPDPVALRDFLKARLPDYMVPTWIVALDRLPLTVAGKVDRNALPSPQASPPTATDPPLADALERELVALWRGLLKIGRIRPCDDFFALGGDSLSATTLILEVAQRFGVDVAPADMVGAGRTVAGLADLVRARRTGEPAKTPPTDVDFAELGAASEGGRNAALFYVDRTTSLRRARPGARWGAIAINGQGFRGPELALPKPPGSRRIAFLGDSSTFDAHVGGNDETWPHGVATALSRACPEPAIDYVNAALPGYGTRQLLALYDHAVAPLEPDIVVIAAYDLNTDTAYVARALGRYSGVHDRPSRLARRWPTWAKAEKTGRGIARRVAAMRGRGLSDFPPGLTDGFVSRLETLIGAVAASGAVPVLLQLPRRLRPGQGPWHTFTALASSAYFMPHLSLAGFHRARDLFDAALADAARRTGAPLLDARDALPSDARHFADSSHFSTVGSRRLAAFVADALVVLPGVVERLTCATGSVPRPARSVR